MTHSKANIFAIGRHRMETDGDGIRSLVVFAGCPLRCKYCINPYTWDNSKTAVVYTPEMLLQKVSVDSVYFQATKGGITFGGGEPLLHARFISDFIDIAPDSWNHIVETSLSVPFENIAALADKIETFVVDIKSMDANIPEVRPNSGETAPEKRSPGAAFRPGWEMLFTGSKASEPPEGK